MSSHAEQALVAGLMPSVLKLEKIDEKKKDILVDLKKLQMLEVEEFTIVRKALDEFGLHSELLLSEAQRTNHARTKFLTTYGQTVRILGDLYFRSGHMMLTSEATNKNTVVLNMLKNDKDLDKYEEAFFHIFTAASVNHKQARFMMAMLIENGLFPSTNLLRSATAKGAPFEYLNYLVDQDKSVVF